MAMQRLAPRVAPVDERFGTENAALAVRSRGKGHGVHLILCSRLIFAVTLFVVSGCEGAAKLTNLSPKQPDPKNDDSIYGEKSYAVQAMLVNPLQKATPLPAMTVYGSPKSVVNKLFRPVIEQYQAEVGQVRRQIEDTDTKIASGLTELDDAESKLAAEYAEIRPKDADRPAATSRNPLRELSKARAAKTKSDEWYKEAFAERIDPIKTKLRGLYRMKYQDSCQLLVLQAGFNNRLFAALESMPASDRKMWKTSEDGKVSVAVTNAEPWTMWAMTSHAEIVEIVQERTGKILTRKTADFQRLNSQNPKVEVEFDEKYDETLKSRPVFKITAVRWLLDIPDDLDANALLSLDQDSAFDLKDITIESAGADGPYLKKADRTNAGK